MNLYRIYGEFVVALNVEKGSQNKKKIIIDGIPFIFCTFAPLKRNNRKINERKEN